MKKHSNTNTGTARVILAGLAFLILIVAGCDNVTSPQQANQNNPLTNINSSDALNLEQTESIYTVEGFYFLPPMVKNAKFNGTFDAGLSPAVEICATTACSELHASFETDRNGSEQVRVDEDDEQIV